MIKIGERIKHLRLNNNLTQKDLSKILQTSIVTIQCWENGSKNPSMDKIIALAKTFCVSTDYLLGHETSSKNELDLSSQSEINLIRNYRSLDYYGKKIVDNVCSLEKARVESSANSLEQTKHKRFIQLFDLPAAAGISDPIENDEYTMIPVDDLVPAGADFMVRIQGESMAPIIRDGDIVYIKRTDELVNGDIGIFCVDGSMYCKHYYLDIHNNLTLVSANPDYEYANIKVDTESSSCFKCYGKVLLSNKPALPDYFKLAN